MLDGIRGNSQSLFVKVLFAIIILVFVFWGVSSFTSTNSNVVATVNGINISPAEFQNMYYQYSGYIQSEEDAPMVQNFILSSLIESKIIQSDAERVGVAVSALDLRNYFASIPEFQDANGQFSAERYRSALEGANLRPASYEASVSASLLPEKMRNLIIAGAHTDPDTAKLQYDYENEQRSVNYILFPAVNYTENAAPTEEELEAAYQERLQFYGIPAQIKLEYITLTADKISDPAAVSASDVEAEYNRRLANGDYYSPTMVSARHILIQVPENATEEQVAEARTKIEGIRNRILVGEDFAAVARAESQDPGSAVNGGDLGYFARERMVPEFADAAFAMQVGDLSEPVRSSFGFHLIKVEGRTEEHTVTPAEAEADIRAELAAKQAEDSLQALADQVFAQVKGGQGLAAAASANNTTLLETQLISQDRLSTAIGAQSADTSLIMGTPAGQLVDKPLPTTSGYTIARVLESNPAGVRSLDDVREDLTQSLTRDKSRRLAQEAAEQARQAFGSGAPGAEYADSIQSTVLFGSDGYVPGLGMSMQMVRAVFNLPMADAGKDLWLSDAYISDEGAILVSLKEVAVAGGDNWLLERDNYVSLISQGKQEIFYEIYLSEMYNQAKITNQNASYFQYWQ